MGNEQASLPVPRQPPHSMFCISLRPHRKIELVHAPPKVAMIVQKVANEVNSLYTGQHMETPTKDKLGVLQFTMAADLFVTASGKEPATMGKLFCIKILEELHKIGFDLVIGSDLMRARFSASALFFRKVAEERPPAKVICVAAGKEDRIILINHDHRVKSIVEETIRNAWPSGIQRSEEEEVLGHVLHELKMNGYPWRASEANIDNNRIVNMVVENLSKINLRLVGGINIKGGTDSLFFLADPKTTKTQFCSISLCRKNRLRLVDCKEETEIARRVIEQNSGFHIEDESVREHHAKLKLSGKPWHCSGKEAMLARQLVARIGEAMLQRGWALTEAIDISRREDDKSMLLFQKCSPVNNASIACICLTSTDHLRLIDFNPGDQEVLKTCVLENYMPGVNGVDSSEGRSLKFDLVGSPWGSWDWGLHARHLLLHLFEAASRLGFKVIASADVSSKFATDGDGNPDYPLDVHSIFLVKMPTQTVVSGSFRDVKETVKDFGENLASRLPTYEEAMR